MALEQTMSGTMETIKEIKGKKYLRNPIKTHFIGVSDNLDNIISQYVLPVAKENDIIVLCQKIVSIVQKKLVYKKDIKPGFWAKFLSKFAKKTPYGFSVGNPYKMQVAINLAGLPRIFLASFCSGVCKLFGIRGVFYIIAGHEINQIDGFYGEAFPQYADMGILGIKNCDDLCDELKNKYGFGFVVADVNDLGENILGISSGLDKKLILDILKDNPAGQSNEQTPIVILRYENIH